MNADRGLTDGRESPREGLFALDASLSSAPRAAHGPAEPTSKGVEARNVHRAPFIRLTSGPLPEIRNDRIGLAPGWIDDCCNCAGERGASCSGPQSPWQLLKSRRYCA